MSKFELRLPQMGESVAEATLISWLKEVGDVIEQDEAVLEIATDKVDTEVPSEVSGVLLEKKYQVNELVQVGDVIAVIEVAEGELPASDMIAEEVPFVPEPNQEISQQTAVTEQQTADKSSEIAASE